MAGPSRTRKRRPRARREGGRGFERLVGHSRALARVVEQARHVASTRATVLIEGEAGTGKGLIAQAIHEEGPRRSGPFVRVRIGTLPPAVVEAELFGSEREADTTRRGRFESASGGTLYLDEIGDAPEAVQIRLVRAIQERAFERAGGTETLRSDVRLIAGTQRDLSADARAGRFREELYYRLGGVRVRMPPLRERLEDIPLLVESFLRRFNREHGRRMTGITRGALDRLAAYAWPGNVRELENVVEGMVVGGRGQKTLDLSDLPEALRDRAGEAPRLELAVGMTVEEAERQLIAATLRYTGHDKPRAAAMLGIGLRTLYRKIQLHRIR
jgi:DNA-binding NtrC family response regulator